MTSDVDRIDHALDAAVEALEAYTPGSTAARSKGGMGPVTDADLAVDGLLRDLLPEPGEGWLSEETTDSVERLTRSRVWVVDPIDGTKEFVQGLPEWCISIGLVVDGTPVAGGICNPMTGERIVGSLDTGVRYIGDRPRTAASCLTGAVVLASRSEVRRGEWSCYDDQAFTPEAMGSVAFKTGLVAAGRADATWTLVPKNLWDVAAGAALVSAAGGWFALPDGSQPTWNGPDTLIPGFVAAGAGVAADVARLLEARAHAV